MKYPKNEKSEIYVKLAAYIYADYVHYFNVDIDTLSAEGEAIKIYIDDDEKHKTKYSDGLFTSSSVMGSDIYKFTLNTNHEFEGEMIIKKLYDTER